MIQHYIQYLQPGVIMSDTYEKKIDHRDHEKVGVLPEYTFGFRFFDREEIEQNGEILRGTPKNFSGWTIEGEVKKLADISDMPDLRANMEGNGYDRVVITKYGQFIPIGEGDSARPVGMRQQNDKSDR